MTMRSDTYYIITGNINGLFDCEQSYKDLEKAKQHAKQISEQLNKICLIVKPVVEVIANTKWVIEDLD